MTPVSSVAHRFRRSTQRVGGTRPIHGRRTRRVTLPPTLSPQRARRPRRPMLPTVAMVAMASHRSPRRVTGTVIPLVSFVLRRRLVPRRRPSSSTTTLCVTSRTRHPCYVYQASSARTLLILSHRPSRHYLPPTRPTRQWAQMALHRLSDPNENAASYQRKRPISSKLGSTVTRTIHIRVRRRRSSSAMRRACR